MRALVIEATREGVEARLLLQYGRGGGPVASVFSVRGISTCCDCAPNAGLALHATATVLTASTAEPLELTDADRGAYNALSRGEEEVAMKIVVAVRPPTLAVFVASLALVAMGCGRDGAEQSRAAMGSANVAAPPSSRNMPPSASTADSHVNADAIALFKKVASDPAAAPLDVDKQAGAIGADP